MKWHRHTWRRYRTMPDADPDYVIDQFKCIRPDCGALTQKRRKLNRGR